MILLVCRPESTRQLLSQSSDAAIRKEGKFRVLNHIFSCKKKKELHATRQRDLSRERHLQEETSEVDDIITMFDCIVEPQVKEDSRKQPNEPERFEDPTPRDHKSLPPIRTQSLPPITLGNSLLTNLHNTSHRTVSGQISHLAHRSQKSKSEHDLFDSKTKTQKAMGPSWKTESSQLLNHKALVSSPSDRMLLHETPSPIDVLCSNHTPYIQRNDQGELQSPHLSLKLFQQHACDAPFFHLNSCKYSSGTTANERLSIDTQQLGSHS